MENGFAVFPRHRVDPIRSIDLFSVEGLGRMLHAFDAYGSIFTCDDGAARKQIGKLLSQKGVSVLFLTANPRILGEGVAGTVGVLTKPTDPETVKSAIDYALGIRRHVPVDPPSALKVFG